MNRETTLTCEICHSDNHVMRFEGWNCYECGQRYDFDEGVMIQLTEEQWQVLSDHYRNKNALETEVAKA